MYCTRQMIQGENFRDWLKNHENRESFPLENFAVYGNALDEFSGGNTVILAVSQT